MQMTTARLTIVGPLASRHSTASNVQAMVRVTPDDRRDVRDCSKQESFGFGIRFARLLFVCVRGDNCVPGDLREADRGLFLAHFRERRVQVDHTEELAELDDVDLRPARNGGEFVHAVQVDVFSGLFIKGRTVSDTSLAANKTHPMQHLPEEGNSRLGLT
jgi:hypothetical protein